MPSHKTIRYALALATLATAALVYLWSAMHPVAGVPGAAPADIETQIEHLSSQAPLALVTEPQGGVGPVRAQIASAAHSIDLSIYELTDPDIESDLAGAAGRGVDVRVILNRDGPFNTHPNDGSYQYLREHGIAVEWSPFYFSYFHQKTLVTDDTTATIMTFNLTPKYYASSRDFGVIDTDPADVNAIEATFELDWKGTRGTGGNGTDLVWSPGARTALLGVIASATSTLDVYNEEMADPDITAALEDAAARGVDVRVVMTYATDWKPAFIDLVEHGVDVRTFPSTGKLYVHAKMIVADDRVAFLGSENFSATSLEKDRELGLLMVRPDIVSSLERTFKSDYAAARPYVPPSN